MAEAVLQVLLDNLDFLDKDKIGLIMGVDKKIKKLSSTLTSIQPVLANAEDKRFKSEAIRNWLCKLKNLMYEIEDVLDECATEFSILEHKNSKLNRYNPKKILDRHKIERRVKDVTEKLDAIAAERAKLHLDVIRVERQSKGTTTCQTGSMLNEPDLVFGRDEEIDKIVDILVNDVRDSHQLSVLPIIGIGGLGKTTLARQVYDDPRVTKHFEEQIWICVSDNFDVRTLVQTMIKSATGIVYNNSDHLDMLQRRLRGVLNQKKYLLVLDDVWNEDQEEWAMLKTVLACGSRGASIVVTTRLKSAASIMGTLPAHELTKLSEEHCWMLLKQHAFGQGVEQHPNLEAIGRQIVMKCGGVPLAAKALGGLLRFKSEETEWVHVKESEIWNLQTSILPASRLSYQHLPLQLRQCFSYFAVYPKNYEVEKEELIYCWMAHGYISSDGVMDVEDVGNRVWNELVLRSLFQDAGTNSKGNITVKMHDLVHDLAQSIMEPKVLENEVASVGRSAWRKNQIRQVNLKAQYVAFPRRVETEVNISDTLKNFKRLRILDASEIVMEDLPSKIGSLKHVRYLNLFNSKVRTLPDTICHLWNLEIVNLNNCYQLSELPKGMRYMKKLRHLLLDGCNSLSEMPPKIGELTSLRTLSVFIVGHGINNQLDQLQNLNLRGRLELGHLERVRNHLDAKKVNISGKSNLRQLVLRWKRGIASEQQQQQQQQETDEKVLEALEPPSNLENLQVYGFRGRYFPCWTSMENVIEINIENCSNCMCLPPLGNLPRLKHLVLDNLPALEYVMEINQVMKDAILFPSLEYLQLKSLPNLKGLLNDEHHLPIREGGVLQCFKALKVLSIWNCCYILTCFPDGWFQHLTALETLLIYACPQLIELPEEGMKCLNSSLKHLTLYNIPNMKGCLPEAMQHLNPSLQSLYLWNLPKVTSLPEWLGNFTSLQCLRIYNCPGLTSLPDSIKGMTNLNSLTISHIVNSELKGKCEKGKGEYWHFISHIPNLIIE